MADYQMREMTLPDQQMKYPRMKLRGQLSLDYVAKLISEGNTFTEGDVVGIIKALGRRVAKEMGRGYSVKIDGFGVFSPRLGLKKDAEPEGDEERKRNARSICVTGINFIADRDLIGETANNCKLKRSAFKPRRSSTKYTPEQRLRLAQEFLEQHPVLSIADYCRLTGLLPGLAGKELRQWASQPDSGIGRFGSGSHRVYVKRVVQSEDGTAI